MRGNQLTSCPVCKRIVTVSRERQVVFAHHDKAHNPCPMGGHALGDAA